MRFMIGDLEVLFPFPYMYTEQYEYMVELKDALDAKGHCLLEMPTGTGKTVALLSLILSYKHAHPEVGKLIYCTRTVPEMTQVMEELRVLTKYRKETLGSAYKGPLSSPPLLLGRNHVCVCPTARRDRGRRHARAPASPVPPTRSRTSALPARRPSLFPLSLLVRSR